MLFLNYFLWKFWWPICGLNVRSTLETAVQRCQWFVFDTEHCHLQIPSVSALIYPGSWLFFVFWETLFLFVKNGAFSNMSAIYSTSDLPPLNIPLNQIPSRSCLVLGFWGIICWWGPKTYHSCVFACLVNSLEAAAIAAGKSQNVAETGNCAWFHNSSSVVLTNMQVGKKKSLIVQLLKSRSYCCHIIAVWNLLVKHGVVTPPWVLFYFILTQIIS